MLAAQVVVLVAGVVVAMLAVVDNGDLEVMLHALCCPRSDSRGHGVIVQLLSVYNVLILLQTEILAAAPEIFAAVLVVNAGKKLVVVSSVFEMLLAAVVAARKDLPRTNASHCPRSPEVRVVAGIAGRMERDEKIS